MSLLLLFPSAPLGASSTAADVSNRISAFNFCDPFDHILPLTDGTVSALDRQHLWGLYSGIAAGSVVFFTMQPDTCVWFAPDNRAGLEFSVVTGDALTPEYQMQANGIGWLTNRARIVFKSGSE